MVLGNTGEMKHEIFNSREAALLPTLLFLYTYTKLLDDKTETQL